MLTLHTGNRLEHLADLLADHLRADRADLLRPAVVAVHSNGMARWLSMRLADRNGVAANLRFPFPASLVWELVRAVLPDERTRPGEAFQTEVLTWRLFRLLGEAPAAPELEGYLRQEGALPRYQLAGRIADVFDQYLVYRPDWILAWEAGEEDHWQARLWRTLVAEDASGARHRARLLAAVQEGLPREGTELPPETRAALPERVALFGIPGLPPALLDILGRLAQHVAVDLYQLAPSREYAADLLSPAAIASRTLAGAADAPYLDTGNRLVASLGRQWAEFQGLVQEHGAAPGAEAFADPGTDTVLGALQSDVLNLRERGPGAEHPPLPAPAPDSPAADLAVHACHSPLREVEVLHDQLLALFEAHPDLRPGDVVVMTPDIDAYTPFIEAVLGHAEDGPRIPYRIADRGLRARSPMVEAAFRLLELPDGRFGVNEVLDLLELGPVRAALELSEGERDRIRTWVRETGIRWGIDAEFRAAQDLPATAAHTWKAGLDRQLLGYALPGDGHTLYEGVLPYPEAEGAWARTLGRFQGFVRDLFRWREPLTRSHAPAEWAALLRDFLARFLATPEPEQEEDMEALHRALARMETCAVEAAADAPVPREIVLEELEAHLQMNVEGAGFLGHGVTFCAMVPMRAIPFKVVAMIGMNDGAFPRIQRPASFDLMGEDYRPGDRSRREDDRYLFLEALLAARRHLHISYVGSDIREDSPRPPSVLVSELLDTVDATFAPPDGGGRASEALVTRHPLQAFSPRYFREGEASGLFSYSPGLRRAAEGVLAQRGRPPAEPPSFLGGPLPEPDEDWRTVEVGDLVRFFRHPARYLLRQRLGVQLEAGEEELEEQEPFALSGLEAHQVRQRILEVQRGEGDAEQAYPLLQAEGLLPHGTAGEIAFAAERKRVEGFLHRLAEEPDSPVLDPVPVDLPAGPVRLVGWLPGLRAEGLLAERCGRLNEGFALDTAIRRLLLGALAPEGVQGVTRVVTLEARLHLEAPEPEAARETLTWLGARYWEGLRSPLPFPPRAAFAHARALARTGDADRAFRAARDRWTPNDYNGAAGERDDPYFALAFQRESPLTDHAEAFEELAEALFGPIAEGLAQ
ncbi:MAG: exodeoxyribonuclease V subunit gamma [Thiohalorhabdus sp.]|uniref:exodeoxyribonuclease V subunit gamma n=1 Tax=Thiohalorhabdus sp. TaxID=3094134 RepID=UPI0039802CE3